MTKIFYDHLVFVDDCFVVIDSLEIETTEKEELKHIVDSTLHHYILTHILDLLPGQHHEEFLERFHRRPHDPRHLQFLEDRIEQNIHTEIVALGDRLKQELLTQIHKHKQKK